MEHIELGGRRWRILQNGPLEHAIWMDRQVLQANLRGLRQQAGEAPEAFANRILDQIIISGTVFHLLSGMLLPEEVKDVDWTPALAEQTSGFLRRLTDERDKMAIRSLLVSLVLVFFVHGLRFSAVSGIASTEAQPGLGTETIT